MPHRDLGRSNVDIVDEETGTILEVVRGEGHPDLEHPHRPDLHVVDGAEAREAMEAEEAVAVVEGKRLSFADAALGIIRQVETIAAKFSQVKVKGEALSAEDRMVKDPFSGEFIIFEHVISHINAAFASGKIDKARGFLKAFILYADPYGDDKPDPVKRRS